MDNLLPAIDDQASAHVLAGASAGGAQAGSATSDWNRIRDAQEGQAYILVHLTRRPADTK